MMKNYYQSVENIIIKIGFIFLAIHIESQLLMVQDQDKLVSCST